MDSIGCYHIVPPRRYRVRIVCSLPTGSHSFIQSKIEQSKHKQKYQDLTIRVLLLFVFRFFTPSFFFLKDSHNLFFSLLPKQRKGKKDRKAESKKHQKTTYLQGKFKSKTNTTKTQLVSVFCPFVKPTQTVSQR